jgi:hypothetical protein
LHTIGLDENKNKKIYKISRRKKKKEKRVSNKGLAYFRGLS